MQSIQWTVPLNAERWHENVFLIVRPEWTTVRGGEASQFFLNLVIHEQAVLTTKQSHRYSLSHQLRDLELLWALAIG